MIGDSPKGIPTITIPATPAPVLVGCQRFWKRPFIYQIREVITTNFPGKPCVVEWPDGMSHLPLFNAEGPIASTKARIAVRMESGMSGQAATVSLERRQSGFPRVRVENYATIFGANRYPPPSGGLCAPMEAGPRKSHRHDNARAERGGQPRSPRPGYRHRPTSHRHGRQS